MRLNKYLADRNFATRRGADKLIEEGKVLVNGKRATLGMQVSETDKMEVKGAAKPESYKYFIYHKPREQTTEELIKDGLFPVGRLDKESEGLMILTNDGRVTSHLLDPKLNHEKEYEVTTRKNIGASFKRILEAGVEIEGYRTKPAKVELVDENTFKIILTEGKKHQIRRMCAALGNEVLTLTRTRILNLKLGALKPGTKKEIPTPDLNKFLTKLRF
ncbi:MAG: pseudouridine synthase [Patescibacteria group bacterium]